MNKQRKTSHILNVFQYDEATGAVTLPSTLVLTAPASDDNSTKVGTTAWVRTYVSGLGYATQSYVTTAIANLVASAPATLDTLNELAAALGNDAAFSTTITTSIGTKVPQARTITINGTTYDLTANRSWTVTSMVYPSAGIAVSTGSAWGTSITDNSANWNTAFGWGNHASAGYLTSALAATTYASLTGAYANPAFVASLAYSKITGVPAFLTSYTETDPYRVTSVAVTGTSTKTITITRADASTVTTTWTDIDTDTNTYATTLGFSGGTLTLTNNNATTVTVSLDGRYYLATNPSAYITLTSLSAGVGISYNNTTGVITSTITQYTDTLARASLSFVAGSGAYNSTTGVITIPTNNNQITNGAGYITSYTETDTLATVTARGSSTNTSIQVNEKIGTTDNKGIFLRGTADVTHKLYYNTAIPANIWEYNANILFQHYNTGSPVTRFTFDTSGNFTATGTIAASNFSGSHSGTSSGTNTGDQTNISGTAASETLATVTGRGATTSTALTFSGGFNDGYITYSLAQINRSGGFVELQYSSGGGVKMFGAGATPITFATTGGATFSGTVAVNNTSPFATGTYSLDINGALLVKNTGRAANITLINADPAGTGNNAFVIHTVSGTLGSSLVDIQGYYGANVTGSTTIRLNPLGGNVLLGSLAGTGTRMVVADSTGTLSTQAIPSGGSSGVTSIVAGTNITISGATGAVTITNGITNNNQLTNGAGYITSSSLTGYLPLSGGIMTGSIVNNTDGAVIIESNATENNNWLWKENAKAWGLFWFNRGTQSGQTIGGYTTIGAELMFMGESIGIAMPSGWTGYYSTSKIAAMISNYNGYIYSASTIYAATSMVVGGNTVYHAGNIPTWNQNTTGNAATTSQRNFDGSLTSPDFYASGWFRNSTALNGLYNSAYDTHFYASGTGQWNFATSNNSWIQIALRPANHQSTVRGYLYADTSNNVGLLTYDGNWALRVDTNKNVQIYGSVSATNLSGTNTGDQTNISGNAATATTASSLAANTSPTIQVLNFTGVGTNSGNANQSYAIYQEGGAWSPPFPDLCIGYHTGIKLGAYFGYNGIRFFNNSDFATQTFSVNDGDNHVRVAYNLYVGGTISGSNLSGTNTGDQVNISGNAATASSVAWGNVSSRPGWMTSASLVEAHANANEFRNSGFYENSGGGSNWPSATWYNSVNVRHSNQANYHGFQVAMSYYDNLLWFRSYQGQGTFQSWAYAISSQNIGSQSVSYASTAGSATSASSATYATSAGSATTASTVTGASTMSGYLTVSANWSTSPYTSALTVIGTYPSITLRNSLADWEFLMHNDGAGDIQYYFGAGYTANSWNQRYTFGRYGDFYARTGSITASGDITAYSDIRVKENIEVIENALEKVKAIRGVTFNRTDLENDNGARHAGVIAQEVLEVLPEVVRTNDKGMYSVAYGNIVGLLIEAIKEQQLQIEELKNKLDNVLSSR